jgi:hypothetical protein
MQIITTTPTSKATTAILTNNKTYTSRRANKTNKQTRRRSSTKTSYESLILPAQQNWEHQKHDLLTKATSARSHHTPEEEKEKLVFNIVYNAPSDMITPPPSPKSFPQAPIVSQSFEANDRILTAKRHGQLKYLMAEYVALYKEGLLFTDHTYNLIFDTYASLRRDGTPLTPMLKSKYLY